MVAARVEGTRDALVRVGDRYVPTALLEKDSSGWWRSTVDRRAHRDGIDHAVGQGALYGINPGSGGSDAGVSMWT